MDKMNKSNDSMDIKCESQKQNQKSKSKGKSKYRRFPNKIGENRDRNIPTHNDYTFYAVNDQIAKDIASVPFNYISGTPFNLTATSITMPVTSASTKVTAEVDKTALPLVMNIQYINSIGKTTLRTDGINMAAVQLYTFIRHANSGAKNYEAADIMMYILAMRDIYSEYFELKRAMGVVQYYNYFNHAIPDSILFASGIQANDLRQNLSQYRGQLNILAEKINSFAVPKYFKMFDRSAFISSNVFCDSSSIRGQMYIFNREKYFKWSATTSTSGTELECKPIRGYVSTTNDNLVINKMSDRINILTEQVNALFLDEDAITMSGDILKAFKDAELYQLVGIDENYSVEPIYDQDILNQIENTIIWSIRPFVLNLVKSNTSNYAEIGFNITQSNQLITWDPQVIAYKVTKTNINPAQQGYSVMNFSKYVFNSHKDDPNYTDVLEWSRLSSIPKYNVNNASTSGGDGNGVVSMYLETCGLELVTDLHVIKPIFGSSSDQFNYSIVNQIIIPIAQQSSLKSTITTAGDLNQFDWHPFIYYITSDNLESPPSNQVVISGDMKVSTLVDTSTFKLINDSAIYSSVYARELYKK